MKEDETENQGSLFHFQWWWDFEKEETEKEYYYFMLKVLNTNKLLFCTENPRKI